MSWISQQISENEVASSGDVADTPYELVGEEVQRLSVLHNLPNLLRGSDAALCMQRVVPKIMLALDKASAEFHMTAATTFYTVLEQKLIHPRTYSQTFLQSMISCLGNKDPTIASVWLDILLDVTDLLPSDIIRSEVLPVAISKSQLSQSVPSRIVSCKILGKASTRVEPFLLRKELVPVILQLCQDVNYEVRACICSQLMFVIRMLELDLTKSVLLPSLVELASDEEVVVRIAAVDTVVEILPHLPADSIKQTIVPLIKKICNQSINAEDDVLCTLSYQIGKLCLGLESQLNTSEKQWLMMFFQQLAHLGVPGIGKDTRKNFGMITDFSTESVSDRFILCRQNCAFNFPAMAIFSNRLGDTSHERLYTTFCDLACDPYFMVRRTIACGIHEVTAVLGPASGIVKNELVKLLRDDVEEVLQGLIPNLGKTMESLAKCGHMGPDNMDAQGVEIGRAIIKCEAEISQTHNWRLHSLLMAQLECLPLCLPSEFIHNHFIPILFIRIHTVRPVPCRAAAARTLLVYLRYNTKHPQRNDMRSRIISEFCRGRSCFSRLTFVKLCGTALELFSRRYFKDFFYIQLLEMADDIVPNIRYQVVLLLPKLKAMLELPGDRKLLLAVEASVRKLVANEKDKDVTALLRRTVPQLEKITLKEEGTGPHTMTKEDLEDKRKQEEEERLVNLKGDHPRRKSFDTTRRNWSAPHQRVPPPPGGIRRAYTGRGMEQRSDTLRVPGGPSPGRSHRTSGPSSAPLPKTTNMASLEDEFYVDAGIRIPQQLAASGELPTYPSRIPNLREILFKTRSVVGDTSESSSILATQTVTAVVTSESKQGQDILNNVISAVDSKIRLKQNDSSPVPVDHIVNDYTKSIFCAQSSSSSGNSNSTSLSSSSSSSSNSSSGSCTNSSTSSNVSLASITKQNSDVRSYISSRVDQLHNSNSKSKYGQTEQKQRDITLVVNRRHSYMDGEKLAKTPGLNSKVESSVTRKCSSSANRRHSYIEKAPNEEIVKGNKNLPIAKSNFSVPSNISRRSYMDMQQASCSSSKLKSECGVTLRKSSIPSRRPENEGRTVDAVNKRRSFIYSSNLQNNCRISSVELDISRDTKVIDRQNSQIPKHPHSLALENKRRHSSLERDDLERLRNHPDDQSPKVTPPKQSRNLRSSLESINSSKEVSSSTSPAKTFLHIDISSDKLVENSSYKSDLESPEDLSAGYSPSEENLEIMLKKRNRLSLSKIPRSPASCHSSPGSSRASSPTGMKTNGNIRARQRTAPNSRSTSPTSGINSSGNLKRPQRLSLGSLNSYMSNLKLSESTSRLPIRKPPP